MHLRPYCILGLGLSYSSQAVTVCTNHRSMQPITIQWCTLGYPVVMLKMCVVGRYILNCDYNSQYSGKQSATKATKSHCNTGIVICASTHLDNNIVQACVLMMCGHASKTGNNLCPHNYKDSTHFFCECAYPVLV